MDGPHRVQPSCLCYFATSLRPRLPRTGWVIGQRHMCGPKITRSGLSSVSLPSREYEPRYVAHERVGVFVFLDPARRHHEDVPSAARRLDDGGVMIDDLSDPAGLVIHARS